MLVGAVGVCDVRLALCVWCGGECGDFGACRRDELAVAAGSTVNRTPFFYFGKKRPPLLKDFFDPKIRKVLPVRRMRRVVEIEIEVRKFDVFE